MTTTTDGTKEADIREPIDQQILKRWIAHESIGQIAKALGLPIAKVNKTLKRIEKLQMEQK